MIGGRGGVPVLSAREAGRSSTSIASAGVGPSLGEVGVGYEGLGERYETMPQRGEVATGSERAARSGHGGLGEGAK